jgi:hypothetical protein
MSVPQFGDLLKRLRMAADLSQEALAERARMSAHAISSLERGARRAPYRDTPGGMGMPSRHAPRIWEHTSSATRVFST